MATSRPPACLLCTLPVALYPCIQVWRAQGCARTGYADGYIWSPDGYLYGAIWHYTQVGTAIANNLLYDIMRTPSLTTPGHVHRMTPYGGHMSCSWRPSRWRPWPPAPCIQGCRCTWCSWRAPDGVLCTHIPTTLLWCCGYLRTLTLCCDMALCCAHLLAEMHTQQDTILCTPTSPISPLYRGYPPTEGTEDGVQ